MVTQNKMPCKEALGRRLSAFQLGTVQLGMEYGQGVDRAKPSEEKAFSILDRAMELGVNCLDTANNYGDAESRIGKWMTARKEAGQPNPFVITKIGPFHHGNFSVLRDEVLYQVEGCLKALAVEKLDCLMLHEYEAYVQDIEGFQRIFSELKSQNLISYSGISAYSEHDYGVLAESGVDAVQIPLNVFDWRQIENGGLQKLEDAGMAVFVRSVFLQGLVFHTPQTLPKHLGFCGPYIEKFQNLCQAFGLSPAVLALSFVLSLPGVTAAVLGCDNPAQMEENARLFGQTVSLSKEQLSALRQAFLQIDPRVVDPRVW